MSVNHFVFSAVLVCVASLFAGIYFLLKKSFPERMLGIYWLSISFWSFTVGFQSPLLKYFSGNVWGWFLHLGCVFIPVLFFHFVVVYTNNSSAYRRVVIFNYILSSAYIFFNTATKWFTSETVYRDNYAYPKPEILYIFYFLSFITMVVWGTVLLFKKFCEIEESKKIWLKVFILLNVLAYSGGLDNFLIMVDLRIPPLYPFGLYLVVPYVIFGSFAVKKINS